MTVRFVAASRLPTDWGEFTMHGFEDVAASKEHVVLTLGELPESGLAQDAPPLLARVHSECLTGDALFSLRCDCGLQLQTALRAIAREGRGALFYLRQEGRGIGLLNKIRAYHLQDGGADTVEANERLGFGADMRDYGVLRPMFEHLHIRRLRLMTNNPRKVEAIEGLGIEIAERIPLQCHTNRHNAHYLKTKGSKLGHLLDR